MNDKTTLIIVGVGGVGFLLLLFFMQYSLEETFGSLLSLRKDIMEQFPVEETKVSWEAPEKEQTKNENSKMRWVRIRIRSQPDTRDCRKLSEQVLSFAERRFEGDRDRLIGFRIECLEPGEDSDRVRYSTESKTGPPEQYRERPNQKKTEK